MKEWYENDTGAAMNKVQKDYMESHCGDDYRGEYLTFEQLQARAKERAKVEEELKYATGLAMSFTGWIRIRWNWIDDTHVELFNTKDSEGSPADDNWEVACLVARLTGWETYTITKDEEYDMYGTEPFKVGLKAPEAKN